MEPKFTDKDTAYQLLYIAYGSVQDIAVIRALRIRDRIAFIARYSRRKQYNMYFIYVADVDTADLIFIRGGTLDECCKYFLAFARYMRKLCYIRNPRFDHLGSHAQSRDLNTTGILLSKG